MTSSRWVGSHFVESIPILPPPRGFVAGAVRGAVVVTVQRHGEFGALRLAGGDERARRGSAGADEQRRLDFEAARRVRSREETLATSNCRADLADEGKFRTEVAVLTTGQAAALLVERRDGAFFGGGRSRSAGARKRARRRCTIAMLSPFLPRVGLGCRGAGPGPLA